MTRFLSKTLDPAVTALVDSGRTEDVDVSGLLDEASESVKALL